jgi:hypothetical protein
MYNTLLYELSLKISLMIKFYLMPLILDITHRTAGEPAPKDAAGALRLQGVAGGVNRQRQLQEKVDNARPAGVSVLSEGHWVAVQRMCPANTAAVGAFFFGIPRT